MIKSVPFIDPARNYQMIKTDLDRAYFDVMTRADLIDRQDLQQFEANFARFIGTKFAVGVNSGYDALHVSLRASGIKPGDEVIVPSHTFLASCSAIVNVGAIPVLIDVTTDFNIDVDKARTAITPKTRGIMPVHLNGYMADMPAVMKLAEEFNLIVVEDAAQAAGSNINGKRAGAWGKTGAFSFFPFKILGGYGDGGAITTDDPEIALFAKRLRYNGEDRFTRDYYAHGYTCLLDNLQAAFLDVKLSYLPSWIIKRQKLAKKYSSAFAGIDDLELPVYHREGFEHIYQNYVVLSKQGDEFSDYLQDHGIGVLTQWRKPYYKYEALGLTDHGYPVTELISARSCSLPMNVEINDEESDYVIRVVRSFYGLDKL